MKLPVYLDYNATTPVKDEVFEAMSPYLREFFGNPSSIHSFGRKTKKAIEDAREKVAELINADPTEIIFTSGGTEANNCAIKGSFFKTSGTHKLIITSDIEHKAVISVCEALKNFGGSVEVVKVTGSGVLDINDFREKLVKRPFLISVMMANNELGTIQPIEELLEMSKPAGVLFHSDTIQYIGKLPIDVKKTAVDFLSISGHKIYAPKGIGALYVKKGNELDCIVHGGQQEKGKRAGTENVPGIVGLGKAAELAKKHLDKYKEVKELRDYFEDEIKGSVKDVKILGEKAPRLPNTSAIAFKDVVNDTFLMSLDLEGVAASTGSACKSGNVGQAQVTKAINLEFEYALGFIRFSLGVDTTKEEIDYAIQKIIKIHSRLKG